MSRWQRRTVGLDVTETRPQVWEWRYYGHCWEFDLALKTLKRDGRGVMRRAQMTLCTAVRWSRGFEAGVRYDPDAGWVTELELDYEYRQAGLDSRPRPRGDS